MIIDVVGIIIVILFVFLLGAAVAVILMTERDAREAFAKGYRQGIEDMKRDWSVEPRYTPCQVNVAPAHIRHRRRQRNDEVIITKRDPMQVSEEFARRLKEEGHATERLVRSKIDDQM